MSERFSASRAGRHMACHASAHLELAIPHWVPPVVSENTGAKATGKSVHKVVEDLIATEYVTPSRTTRFSAKDMLGVGQILTYIGELWSTRRFTVLSEETVIAEWLDTKPQTTADLVLHTKDEIHVLDIKWGKIEVPVVGNEQLLFYAASYADRAPQAKGVTVHILQPRADNMSEWYVDAATLAAFMDEARKAEAAIQAGDTTFGPSDHCKFCPANPHSRGDKGKPLCPEMMQLLYPNHIDEEEILND